MRFHAKTPSKQRREDLLNVWPPRISSNPLRLCPHSTVGTPLREKNARQGAKAQFGRFSDHHSISFMVNDSFFGSSLPKDIGDNPERFCWRHIASNSSACVSSTATNNPPLV